MAIVTCSHTEGEGFWLFVLDDEEGIVQVLGRQFVDAEHDQEKRDGPHESPWENGEYIHSMDNQSTIAALSEKKQKWILRKNLMQGGKIKIKDWNLIGYPGVDSPMVAFAVGLVDVVLPSEKGGGDQTPHTATQMDGHCIDRVVDSQPQK